MEHMCTRCARLLLQNTRRAVRPPRISQLQPFSSVSSRFAQGAFDLSTPLPPSSDERAPPKAQSQNSSKAEELSRFRKVGSQSSQRPEARPRREGVGNARPAPGQLLRRSGNRPPSSASGRVRPQSQGEADVFRSNRNALLSAPNGRRPAIRYTDQENQDVEENEDDDGFADAEEEITFLEEQLSENSDSLDEKDVVLMESRLKLLTEDETLTPEQRSILEALSDGETLSKMSENEMNRSLDRLNAVTQQQLGQQEDMSDEDREVASLSEYLSENADKLDDNQIIALESRLKVLTENDSLTDEQRSLLTSLNLENMANMSDGEINSTLEQLNTLTDEQQRDPEAVREKEMESLMDQISEENLSKLSGNQIIAIESRLKLLVEGDGLTDEQRSLLTTLSPGSIDNISQEQIDASLKQLNTLTVKEDATAFLKDQRSGGESTITDEERTLLTQLSETIDLSEEQVDSMQNRLKEIQARQLELVKQLMDENYDNLTKDQEQSILRELNLVNEDGTLENPAEKYVGLLAADSGAAVEDQDEDEEEEKEESEEDERELSGDEEIDKYIDEVIDPSPIPTEPLPYTPKEHTTDELRLDWPNTPLSGSGLTESVIQKVTWLAKRLPHGYWTPRQIAERYEEGYMVRFNSEEEKETVLKLAAEMANARAAKTSERSGEEVQAGDMQFESLGERADEKQRLTDSMTRGVYPVPGKEGNRVMEGVMRQLDNNATYRSEDAAKFKGRIERLIGMVGGRARGGGPAGEAGAKK